MKKKFKIISKLALLLVIFGFFQPVACDLNGFEIAQGLISYEKAIWILAGLGVYMTFFLAVISIIYTLFLLLSKKDICSSNANKTDLALLLGSVAGSLAPFITIINGNNYIENGFYIIIAGWITSLLFYSLSKSAENHDA